MVAKLHAEGLVMPAEWGISIAQTLFDTSTTSSDPER